MNGPRLVLLAALAALALASTASAADLVIKVRSKHVSSLGAFKTNGSHGTLRNAVKAWGRPSTRKGAGPPSAACTSATRRPRSSSSTRARSSR